MQISPNEIQIYFDGLENIYGKGVITSINELNTDLQLQSENKRHSLSHYLEVGTDGIQQQAWNPGHFLLLATHRCDRACPHCIVNSSPYTTTTASDNLLNNLANDRLMSDVKEISLSGGEVFLLGERLFEIIGKFPIQSLVTNGFWAKNIDKAKKIMLRFKEALSERTFSKKFTFSISLDTYHSGDLEKHIENVGNAIESIFDNQIPNLQIALSRANGYDEEPIHALLCNLQDRGFELIFQGKDVKNELLTTIKYIIIRNGITQDLIFDIFPLTPIGRSVNMPESNRTSVFHLENTNHPLLNQVKNTYIDTDNQYQYVVTPNGIVTTYNVYASPPLPFSVGNMNIDTWDNIAARVSMDPISLYVRKYSIGKLLDLVIANMPELNELIKNILNNFGLSQQVLYILLLDRERKMQIHKLLMQECINKGLLVIKPGLEEEFLSKLSSL